MSLKSSSISFGEDKKRILDEMDKALDQTITMKPYIRKTLIFSPKFLKRELKIIEAEDKELITETKGLNNAQREFFNKIKSLDILFSDIYAYDPALDFGNLKFSVDTEREEVIVRTDNAKKALEKLKVKIADYDLSNFDKSDLIKSFEGNIALLAGINISLNSGNNTLAENYRKRFISDYEYLRLEAFKSELGLFNENQFIELATEEKNQITGYEKLLQRITELQKRISG
jgi:hypothetical protein